MLRAMYQIMLEDCKQRFKIYIITIAIKFYFADEKNGFYFKFEYSAEQIT